VPDEESPNRNNSMFCGQWKLWTGQMTITLVPKTSPSTATERYISVVGYRWVSTAIPSGGGCTYEPRLYVGSTVSVPKTNDSSSKVNTVWHGRC